MCLSCLGSESGGPHGEASHPVPRTHILPFQMIQKMFGLYRSW